MGVALGWMALALAAVAGAPDDGRGGVPIKYTVRFVEADGIAWREAVFTRLTPVTRQGSATVWTAPHDVATRLVDQAQAQSSARIMRAPRVIAWSGATAHIIARTYQELVTQAAWNMDDHSVQMKPEMVRTGSTTTLMGRKLDQGVLVQIVLQDTQVLAVHHIAVAGSKQAGLAASATTTAGECADAPDCCDAAQMTTSARAGQDDIKPAAGEPVYPWSDIPVFTDAGTAKRPTTSNVNKKQMTVVIGKVGARSWKKRSRAAFVVAAAPAPAPDCCSSTATCSSCAGDSGARKVALEVPEIESQEIAGEWLIPTDGILLVSFGPHTVADKDGKAVVRERLAIIEAEAATEPAATPSIPPPDSAAPTHAAPLSPPSAPSVHGYTVPVLPAPEAVSPAREIVPPPLIAPPSAAEAPVAPMPPMPARSIPQGYHGDGKAASLPQLPVEQADDDDSSESAEPRPSPQARKRTQPEPAPAPDAKPAPSVPSGDTAAKKAQFSVPGLPTIPAMFQSGPSVGLQFLVPIKPISLKLPFDRRLELEIYGRVVRSPSQPRSSADLATKPAKDGATTK